MENSVEVKKIIFMALLVCLINFYSFSFYRKFSSIPLLCAASLFSQCTCRQANVTGSVGDWKFDALILQLEKKLILTDI
jgi:hypothetical protein